MRNFVVALTIIIGVLILAILLLPYVLDLNRYRDKYLPILEQALHRKVDVQDVRLTVFPKLGMRLQDIKISDDSVFSPVPFATVPMAQVVVRWAPLLQQRIQVDSLLIQDLRLQIIRSKEGLFNVATIGKASPFPASPNSTTLPGNSFDPLFGMFGVKHFFMTGGNLQYEDRLQDPPHSYHIKDLELQTESVEIGQTALIQFSGMLMPFNIPFVVKGHLGPLQVGPVHETLDIPSIDVMGTIGKVEWTVQGKMVSEQLDLNIRIPIVTKNDIPIHLRWEQPIGFRHFQAHVGVTELFKKGSSLLSELSIDPVNMDLELGESTIHLSGKGTPVRFSLIGNSSSLSSQDLPLILPAVKPFSLEPIQFEIEIQKPHVDLKSLIAKAFEGTLQAEGKWDRRQTSPTFFLDGTFQNFSAGELMNVVKSSSLSITGVGDFQWKVTGVLRDAEPPQLQGPVRLTLRDGQLVGFDFIDAMEKALGMPGGLGESTGVTAYSQILGQADLYDGGLFIRQLIVEATNFSLKSVGSIGIDQSIGLQGKLTVSSVIAGRIIARFPMAKLVKQQEELVLPFKVEGTVQAPVVQLDTRLLGNQLKQKAEQTLEKVLKGNKQELRKLFKDGQDILKKFLGK